MAPQELVEGGGVARLCPQYQPLFVAVHDRPLWVGARSPAKGSVDSFARAGISQVPVVASDVPTVDPRIRVGERMKIASSSIAMQGRHRSVEVHQKKEALRYWRGIPFSLTDDAGRLQGQLAASSI